jgi:hypothetical protein
MNNKLTACCDTIRKHTNKEVNTAIGENLIEFNISGCEADPGAAHQTADERLHGLEPDRAGQDEPGPAQAP